MSNHTNNMQPTLPRRNSRYAWYDNNNRVNLDLVSPPPRPFSPVLDEGGVVDQWLLSLQDRIFTIPPNIMSFPRPLMQLLVFHDNLANDTYLQSRRVHQHSQQQDSEIIPSADQRKALEKLKKEIYNPIPKKIIQRLGSFSKQNNARKSNGNEKKDKQVNGNDDDDDYKKCVICLEDFQVKEIVMVTPCHHLFHEECIVPWVKSHGKCPVCRFLLCEKSETSSTNNDNLVSNRITNDLMSIVTSGSTSNINGPFWRS
ncbi:uncharacterized protein [Rutidosis leptorrhynchoides]|uniref:uncharacterized protein n=1 Tax=Rutidosis leptorrhynchoides TaxID=125765 RepID=UPI003A9A1E35